MGDPSRDPAKAPPLSSTCPYGILNLAAALESHSLLAHHGTDAVHTRLRDWLLEHYLDGNMALVYTSEPLGRRIRSVGDLGLLVSAYSRARALRRPKTSRMENELYFYGQGPGREEGLAAGKFMQEWFKAGVEVDKKPGLQTGEKKIRKNALTSVREVDEEEDG